MNAKTIKILLVKQIFSMPYGGISRLFTEMLRLGKEKKSFEQVEISSPIFYSPNFHLSEYESTKISRFTFFKKMNFKGKSIISNLLLKVNRAKIKNSLKDYNHTVFLPTYFYPYFLGYCKKPFVLTVYDMIHEKFAHLFKNDDTKQNKLLLMEKAERIIAISESTKADIISIYPQINPEKIDIVHLSYSIEGKIKNLLLPDNFILFVGNRGSYKNFKVLLQAFKLVRPKHRDYSLVCAGGGLIK